MYCREKCNAIIIRFHVDKIILQSIDNIENMCLLSPEWMFVTLK